MYLYYTSPNILWEVISRCCCPPMGGVQASRFFFQPKSFWAAGGWTPPPPGRQERSWLFAPSNPIQHISEFFRINISPNIMGSCQGRVGRPVRPTLSLLLAWEVVRGSGWPSCHPVSCQEWVMHKNTTKVFYQTLPWFAFYPDQPFFLAFFAITPNVFPDPGPDPKWSFVSIDHRLFFIAHPRNYIQNTIKCGVHIQLI